MASHSALLPQSRHSRSESSANGIVTSLKNANSALRIYPGSLHRQQRSNTVVPHYRSMLDIDTPTLRPINIENGDSMEDWVTEKLSQTAQTFRRESWADILCFYTATNGAAPAAPTRASPAPQVNGKVASPPPQEIPQSVSSADPKVAAQQASDMRNIVRRKLTGYVGFANLPNQWHRKSVRKGFNFNVMVVGRFPYCSNMQRH
jgi:septin 7